MDFVASAVIKTAMPATCSMVHTLLKTANEMKSVVAFRAVLVIDMVKAPKFFVIAAEHDDPKNPIEENKTITPIFCQADHVRSSSGALSRNCWYVPGCIDHAIPDVRSPFTPAATVIAMRAIE